MKLADTLKAAYRQGLAEAQRAANGTGGSLLTTAPTAAATATAAGLTARPAGPDWSAHHAHRICRSRLVSVSAAEAILEIHRDSILDMIDCGKFLWVFDLAAPGARRRALRLWRREVDAFKAKTPLPAMADDAAWQAIIGFGDIQTLRVGSVAAICQTTPTQVHTWLTRAELFGSRQKHEQTVTRTSLTKFLARRRDNIFLLSPATGAAAGLALKTTKAAVDTGSQAPCSPSAPASSYSS